MYHVEFCILFFIFVGEKKNFFFLPMACGLDLQFFKVDKREKKKKPFFEQKRERREKAKGRKSYTTIKNLYMFFFLNCTHFFFNYFVILNARYVF